MPAEKKPAADVSATGFLLSEKRVRCATVKRSFAFFLLVLLVIGVLSCERTAVDTADRSYPTTESTSMTSKAEPEEE